MGDTTIPPNLPETAPIPPAAPGLPSCVQPLDLMEMRLAISEEGRAQNAVVALEAQLELRRLELQRAAQHRAAIGGNLNARYQLSGADSYNQLDGTITRKTA